jgi:POT family proton-dependent oligopeptide transporter
MSAAAAGRQATPEEERIRVRALFIIFGVVMLFWMAFHQNGMTLIRWARDHTSPFLGIDFRTNAALTKAINPALVIILTPLLVMFWTALRKRNWEASTPRKMMFGMLLTASCFLVMGIGGLQGGDYGQVSIWWLLGGYFLVTLGELCVSPMGLSVVSKLAPPRHGGLLMGGWFVATALGNYLAGAIAVYWQRWDHSTFFFLLVGTSLLAAAVLWLVMGRLEHAMSLVAPTPVRATPPGDVEPQPVGATTDRA